MSHIYTDTIPRMPRRSQKRGMVETAAHVRRLEEKAEAEAAARRLTNRELRVLKRVRFDFSKQPLSVQASLKLIGHISPT